MPESTTGIEDSAEGLHHHYLLAGGTVRSALCDRIWEWNPHSPSNPLIFLS